MPKVVKSFSLNTDYEVEKRFSNTQKKRQKDMGRCQDI